MMLRRAAVVALAFVLVTAWSSAAHAGSGGGRQGDGTAPARVNEDGATVRVSTEVPGSGEPEGGAGGGRPVRPSPWRNCFSGTLLEPIVMRLVAAAPMVMSGAAHDRVEAVAALDFDYSDETATGYTVCDRRGADGSAAWVNRTAEAGPVDPTPALLVEAERTLVVPDPQVQTSPPMGGTHPVGLPVWFWAVDTSDRSETASVPGVSVTVDATVAEMTVEIIEPGPDGTAGSDGSEVVRLDCGTAGVAYDPAIHTAWESSDCSHVFDWPGEATVTVSVVWDLSWSSSTGASGTLPSITRTRDLTITPVELQAVVD